MDIKKYPGIKFLDLLKINQSFEPELSNAIRRVLDSGFYLLGDEVKTFEKEYAEFIGTRHCIALASGLDALRLILNAYIEMGQMSEGDEIIVPANTFIASMLAITANRLTPVLVEPDINTYNLDISLIEKYITPRTRGVMIVHLYGQACWSQKLIELAEKYHLRIIEDNAQAAGAYYVPELQGFKVPKSHSSGVSETKPENIKSHNSETLKHWNSETLKHWNSVTLKRTGSLGNAAGHSFYPGKNLAALGDGGAVTTDDDELADVVRTIANYGSKIKYQNLYKGLNSRLDEIQAAFLRVKLPRLDADNQHRREIAQYYLNNINHPDIILPYLEGSEYRPTSLKLRHMKGQSTEDIQKTGTNQSISSEPRALSPVPLALSHIWHLFVIRSPHRDILQQHLTDHGVQTVIHYPIPPHKQDAYREWNEMSLPVTEKIHREVLSLPVSPLMTIDEAAFVTQAINTFHV